MKESYIIFAFRNFVNLKTLYLSAKYRSRNIHNRLNSIRFLLRDFQFQLNKHKNELQGYSIYDPIPFGPLVASSDQYFQETEFFFHELLKRYGEIKEKSNSTQTLRKIYYHISPATWHKIDRSVGELTKQCSNFANKIDMLSEIRNKIFQANWEIAKSCQELVRSLNESFITVEQIRRIGLYGDELERTHSVGEIDLAQEYREGASLMRQAMDKYL